VNLASLHEGTLESELFGHERGAFTGADSKRVGKLELADGGTVFLDEVGELSPRMQARLLEFLQTSKIRPMGAQSEVELNVRVISATHRDLPKLIVKGEFREDLFHRLCVAMIELPSLREFSTDFDSIVHSCLEEVSLRLDRKILRVTEDFAHRLESYDWPGNYRELRNVLEFAVQACTGDTLCSQDLPPYFVKAPVIPVTEPGDEAVGAADEKLTHYGSALGRFERGYLDTALRRNGGRINQTAREIGLNKTSLIRRIRKHSINVQSKGL